LLDDRVDVVAVLLLVDNGVLFPRLGSPINGDGSLSHGGSGEGWSYWCWPGPHGAGEGSGR